MLILLVCEHRHRQQENSYSEKSYQHKRMLPNRGGDGVVVPNICNGAVREEFPHPTPALSDPINQAPAKFQHARVTKNILLARSAEEVGLHLRGNRSVIRTQASENGQPHRYVRGRHENLSTHDPARTLQIFLKWHQQGALAFRKSV